MIPKKVRGRRGKYAQREGATQQAMRKDPASLFDLEWTAEDIEHCRQLEADSPLLNIHAKHLAATRATELSRQLRELDARARTVDEEKILISASSQYRKWLEVLRVTEKIKEDGGEL